MSRSYIFDLHSAHFPDKWHWLMYWGSVSAATCHVCHMSHDSDTCELRCFDLTKNQNGSSRKSSLKSHFKRWWLVIKNIFYFWSYCIFLEEKINDLINNSNTIISLCFIHKQIQSPHIPLVRWGDDHCCDH